MFNDHLLDEMAKESIQRREQEAEIYGLQSRLGYREHRAARWLFVLIVMVALLALVIMP